MGGASRAIKSFSRNPGRSMNTLSTWGLSEVVHKSPIGKMPFQKLTESGPDKIMSVFGVKGPGDGAGGPGHAGYTDNPAQTLAQTGGAPLLASIAMGADVKQSIASYFGGKDWDSFYENLDDSSKNLVDGVKDQLTTIQTNTDLKNKAVQNVVNDFPNIAMKAAQAHQDAGGEFDSVTKDYLNKALSSSAARYSANGQLSSGAADEASARVGADLGLKKLDYMNNAGDKAYDQGVQGWQARYNEVNALRGFQNTMTLGAAGQGFSAVQSALGRTQQTNMANAGYANASANQDKQNDAQMFGAIGGVVGTVAGTYFGGPVGGAVGAKVGQSAGESLGTSSSNNSTGSNWA